MSNKESGRDNLRDLVQSTSFSLDAVSYQTQIDYQRRFTLAEAEECFRIGRRNYLIGRVGQVFSENARLVGLVGTAAIVTPLVNEITLGKYNGLILAGVFVYGYYKFSQYVVRKFL